MLIAIGYQSTANTARGAGTIVPHGSINVTMTEPTGLQSVAVLGATGATGRAVAEELVRRQIPTRVVSRSEANLREAFDRLPVDRLAADLVDPDATRRAVPGHDGVIVCLGLPPSRFGQYPAIARSIAAAIQDEHAHGVLVSSYWSYSPVRYVPIDEDHPRRPTASLARLRKEQEDILCDAGACVAMLPDFFGPGVRPRHSMINDAWAATRRGRRAAWFGNPDAERDFLYVPDVGPILVELAMRRQGAGQRVNVPGSGHATPRALIEMAAERVGTRPRIQRIGPALAWLAGLLVPDVRALRPLLPLYERAAWMSGERLEAMIGSTGRTSYEDALMPTLESLEAQA